MELRNAQHSSVFACFALIAAKVSRTSSSVTSSELRIGTLPSTAPSSSIPTVDDLQQIRLLAPSPSERVPRLIAKIVGSALTVE